MPIKRAGSGATREKGRSRDDEDDDRYAYADEEESRGRRRRARDEDDEPEERPRSRRRDEDEEDDDRPRRRPRSRDEEDEDEPPRRRARRDDDEEDDEDRGSRRRPRARDRDDEDDDREPRRERRGGRRRDDDDEEDEPPRSRVKRRGRDDDDEEDEPPRSRVKRRGRDDDDDDDDRGRRRKAVAAAGAINRGWAGADRTQAASGDFAPSFKMDKEKDYVVKFLDDEPYASYRQHWLERKGKKSFVCPEDPEDPKGPRCPLCDAGDRTQAKYSFNIVDLTDGEKPVVVSWDVGIRLLNQLKKINADKRIGPLSAPYFAVSRSGTGTNAATQLSPIKERDLYDDWGVEELTDKEIAALRKKRFDNSIIDVPSKRTLNELAEELLKYDDR